MRTAFCSFCFLLLIPGIPRSGYAQDDDRRDAMKYHAAGSLLYDAGKYAQAADTLEIAVRIFEKTGDIRGQIEAQLLLGECHANSGRCDMAISGLQATLDLALSNFAEDQPEVAKSYYYLSRATGGCARKFDEAKALMRRSIMLTERIFGAGSAELALNFNFMGYFFNNTGQPDSALAYLNEALAIRKAKSAPDDIETSHVLFNLANAYEKRSELSRALKLHLEALTIRRDRLGEDHPTVSNSITAIGSIYQKFGNYDRALDYYRRGLDIRKRTLGRGHTNVAGSYYTIGNLYGTMFNYHQSLQYIQEGNRILSLNLGNASDVLATYVAYAGMLCGKTGDHANAIVNLGKAEAMAEKVLHGDHPYRAIVYNICGDYYTDQMELAKASRYFEKAIRIFRKAFGAGSVREGDVYAKMGVGYAGKRDLSKALEYYHRALAIYNDKVGVHNPKSAGIYHGIGNVYADMDRFDEALAAYQNGLRALVDNDKTLDLRDDPQQEDLRNRSLALKIASSKGNALFKKARLSVDSTGVLEKALAAYGLAIRLIDDVEAAYNNDDGRAELYEQSRNVYDNSIAIASRLFAITGNRAYAERAFAICAKSKSALLLENMRDEHAKSMAGVPDSLIDAERDIEIEMAFHKNALYQAQTAGDTALVKVHERNIFESGQKLEQLKLRLEEDFASYYRLKYQRANTSGADVQASISAGTAVVEYFVGDDAIYRFTITAEDFDFASIPRNDGITGLVDGYERSLTDAAFIMNDRDSADRLYTASAFGIYQLLLEDVFEKHRGITKLVVVPDDFLAQLNFNTLLYREASSPIDYADLDFLARRCRISYVYSTFLMDARPSRDEVSGDLFAGFAPSYPGSQFTDLDTVSHPLVYLAVRDGTIPLPGAQEEVRRISGLMGGNTWLDREATETNFKLYAGEYDILHLAMHSLLNNENPNFSELLFNHEMDDRNDGYLNIAEIYNLKLNAQLVVLSACSSGYGKIQQGEGPITLSRAFSYAGCPSVVMSLWKIPDAVTMEIMTNFYQELSDGKPKDEALRVAQLRFLDETEDPLYRHPYFWAGFVVMGSTDPLPSQKPPWVVYGIIFAGFALAMILYLKKRRHAQSSFS